MSSYPIPTPSYAQGRSGTQAEYTEYPEHYQQQGAYYRNPYESPHYGAYDGYSTYAGYTEPIGTYDGEAESVGYDGYQGYPGTALGANAPPSYTDALTNTLCQCDVCLGKAPPAEASEGSYTGEPLPIGEEQGPTTTSSPASVYNRSPELHSAPAPPMPPPPPSYDGRHQFVAPPEVKKDVANVMPHLPPPPPPPPYTECVLGDPSAMDRVMMTWYNKVSTLPLANSPNARPCPAPATDRSTAEWIAACNRWWKATYKKPAGATGSGKAYRGRDSH